MSDTAYINAINLQVMAEDQIAADKAAGTYNANKKADDKYYLWQSDFQTIPTGMDGQPEEFAAQLRAALPQVNTLRLPFNQFSFNADGTLHEQYERFLHAAAEQGFNIIFCYFGGDVQEYGDKTTTADQIYDALDGEVFDGVEEGWNSLLDWLDANGDVKDAVYGYEVMNEPAAYATGEDRDKSGDADRFVELYAQHVAELAELIDSRADGKILVGGWNYSAKFDELDTGDIDGMTALDYIRAVVGDDLVWSGHLYPGWVGTDEATTTEELEALWEAHYAVLAGDDLLITETNGKGSLVDNPDAMDTSAYLYARSAEWFAENGIGLTWFPGVETGASNFVMIDANGQLRYMHANSLAHGLNLYSLDESDALLAGDDVIETVIVRAKVRGEEYQDGGKNFEDVDGVGFGFGYDGDDRVQGHDRINDFIYGGHGSDTLAGLGANDHLYGQYGDDLLFGGDGNDHLFGGDGDDRLNGGAGDDQLNGDAGADTFVIGTGGDDSVMDFAAEEEDRVILGDGQVLTLADLVALGSRIDANDDGRNDDLVLLHDDGSTTFYGFFTRNADAIAELANPVVAGTVSGSNGNDRMELGYRDANGRGITSLADWIRGRDGDDRIWGGGGNDRIWGDDGNDRLDGSTGDDVLFGGRGDDTLIGGAGSDTLFGIRGSNMIYGGNGDDVIDPGAHASEAFGGAGSDEFLVSLSYGAAHTLTGGTGADTFRFLFPSSGRITLTTITDFEIGHDHLAVDDVDMTDFIEIGLATGHVIFALDGDDLILTLSQTDAVRFESIDVEGFLAEYGLTDRVLQGVSEEDEILERFTDTSGRSTTQAADLVVGDDGNNRMWFGAGSDVAYGRRGNDLIYAGSGDDFVAAGVGDDTVYGGSGDDVIMGQSGRNALFGGDGNDLLMSGVRASVLDGGRGRDILQLDLDRGANHTATGGFGADHFEFLNLADRPVSRTTVTDFNVGVDTFDIDGLDGGTFVQEALDSGDGTRLAQFGDDLHMIFGSGDVLIFQNVDLDAFRDTYL